MFTESDFRISRRVYAWTCRILAALEKILPARFRLHGGRERMAEGDIFVFNHFARFETIIPQYLLYRETGALCRTVAHHEFFRPHNPLSRYLLKLGATPTDYPGLFPFLVAEVMRGRKIVIFPEGGMVKDRRVMDPGGGYSIFSRSSNERRKHHTGAAVVALAVEAFKAIVRDASAKGQWARLHTWTQHLGLGSTEELLARAARPTTIIPCNITFFPIRPTENRLKLLADLLGFDLSPRAAEELLIEGNLLFRRTDMDLWLGEPHHPSEHWTPFERKTLLRVGQKIRSLKDLFSLTSPTWGLEGRWLDRRAHLNALRTRDAYMEKVYANVTVNLGHLASRLILRLVEDGVERIPTALFHRCLSMAVQKIQNEPSLHLHESLRNPGCLREGQCPAWLQFLDTITWNGLVEQVDGHYRLLPKLREESAFDRIRLENPVAVYANEIAPLAPVLRVVGEALAESRVLEESRGPEAIHDRPRVIPEAAEPEHLANCS